MRLNDDVMAPGRGEDSSMVDSRECAQHGDESDRDSADRVGRRSGHGHLAHAAPGLAPPPFAADAHLQAREEAKEPDSRRANSSAREDPDAATAPFLHASARAPRDNKVLCVSIHDVAPATWSDCLVLHKALREVAPDVPLTWLIVPRYHGHAPADPAMDEALTELLAHGHELALHGYTHLDTAAPLPGLRSHFVRNVYTTGEGEFAAIDEADALQRLDLGLDWFASRQWPVHGFVPPAWLASPGAWRAIAQRSFSYTTTITRFHFLASQRSLWSPSLMYTARQATGRWLSPRVASAAAAALSRNPLVRFGLHPADARHPALLRHAQGLLEKLLADRAGMTKHQFAQSYQDAGTEPASTGAAP